jgi:glycosyltransferase involved in cell wall biosynthesis
MRVVHVLPHRGGGGEIYVDMVERLADFEHQRLYLSAGRTPSSGLLSIPVRWPRIAVASRRADLIHCHGDVTSAIALPLLRTRPAVVTTHGLNMLRRASGPRLRLMVHAMTGAVERCRVVICTSQTERDELAAVLPAVNRAKLCVIHNGIDPPVRTTDEQRESIRGELGVGDGTVLGLFAGQLDPNKAPLLAAKAARRVYAEGVPFVLAIAGDGKQAAAVRGLAGDAVRVLGYRSDLDKLLGAADVFVFPSEREGLSFALIEAMGYGLAIVASDGRGNPEAVGDAGILFAAGDEDTLSAALRKLCDQPELRSSLGVRARARMLEAFSVDRFLAATEEVYKSALQGRTVSL